MTIEKMQKLIDKTNYWDLRVLDVKASYFGDEIVIFLDNDSQKHWKLTFLSCREVWYLTDADRRTIPNVKTMKKPQLGYFAQDITVSESENADFYKVCLNLTIMEMKIECRDILVEKISEDDMEIFWKNNQ